MKFRYEGDEPVNTYQGHHVEKGDVIELGVRMSLKAKANPRSGLVEVPDSTRVTKTPAGRVR